MPEPNCTVSSNMSGDDWAKKGDLERKALHSGKVSTLKGHKQ